MPTRRDDPSAPLPALLRRASLSRTASAVFWSFFGVRRRGHYQADAAELNPVHVIVMGIVGAALFIAVPLALIKFVVLR